MIKQSNKENLFHLCLLWLAFTSAAPFTFIQIPYHPHKYLITILLCVFFIFLSVKRKILFYDKSIFYILSLQSLYFILAAIYHNDLAFLALFFQSASIIVALLYTINNIKLESLVQSILYVSFVMAIFGGVVFVLGFFDLISPVGEYKNTNGKVLYSYFLTFSNAVAFTDNGQIIRVAGYFDEPGTFAFFLIHALVLNKLYKDNKVIELSIIIGGAATLSMAFYISIFIYMCFFYIKVRMVKHFIFIFLGAFLLNYFISENSDLYNNLIRLHEMTFQRFELAEGSDRIVKGDSRTENILIGLDMLENKFFFGYGLTYIKDQTQYGLASILGPLVTQGFVGFIILFLHVLNILRVTYFKVKITKQSLVSMACIFILLINYIQRPFVFGFYTYFILLCIYMLVKNKSKCLEFK